MEPALAFYLILYIMIIAMHAIIKIVHLVELITFVMNVNKHLSKMAQVVHALMASLLLMEAVFAPHVNALQDK